MDEELKQFYDVAREKGEYWLSLLFSSCCSPIEKKFIGHFYSFFLKNNQNIRPILIHGDMNILTANNRVLYSIDNDYGLTLTFDSTEIPKPEILDKDEQLILMYWGFQIYSSGLKYQVIPQYPVFDEGIIKFLDFGVLVYDGVTNSQVGRFGIECDGHEWHSTREQLRADNIRSRFLTKNSFHLLRYSGSEIYKMNDDTILELENTIYKSIFGKESRLFQNRKY